ncbi:double-strand break repair helicase AddA [Qipengyuania sp. JC766]|uniref:double-strand break repair helicase AddA n=1 Tax=Qipengyuania sp. JC766 TaxID=3232139 RepID=UPI003457B025
MSSSPGQTIHGLADNQAKAVDPADSVWLSASAGTGKTHVLSSRVLRLLLQPDVEPSQILCLTFTKAGAAEMAVRVNEKLASWVRMKPEVLAANLRAIGAPVDPATLERARTRFASVLDCPGGGLRIDTIHAFSQWLLAAFPQEAGLLPGTKAMEDRDRDLLAHRVLADMLVDAKAQGDDGLLDALAMLSVRMAPDGARRWLMRCAEARELWFGTGAWQAEDIPARTKQLLGLTADAGHADAERLCSDDVFPVETVRRFAAAMAEWGTKQGLEFAEKLNAWLAAEPAGRLAYLDVFLQSVLTAKGEPRSFKKPFEANPALPQWQDEIRQAHLGVSQFLALLDLVDWLVPALQIGQAFARRWDEAKLREGFVDFDDQIRRAAALLGRSDLAEWVRYKLDRQFDHILIDEAQDTNQAQWDIINALTEDFFAGAGQRGFRLRTIFVVGDYKQAIFRFQGTSPRNFQRARDQFDARMADAARGAVELKLPATVRPLQKLGLGRSYRTSQPVLSFVDDAIRAIGPERFGLPDAPEDHRGETRPGQVVLWQPVPARPEEDQDGSDSEEEQTWISEPERRMADRIAQQVASWVKADHPHHRPYPLHKGTPRNAGPGDVMILVRKRRELAGLIVARLHAAGVPVAGVDRLRLGAPLAVKDLMAAVRFAAQPRDDLSLACLLVSPLIGWSQQQLLDHGYREKGVTLWDHLRRGEHPDVVETVGRLRDLLRLADYEPPQALLHWMLVGPWRGRAKLSGRLGSEANDPIDELLNAAHAYSSAHVPSLAGFIRWFDAGEGELKREAGANAGMVQVLTVHGAKGLQRPIVILADATGDPDASKTRDLTLREELPGGEGPEVPIPGLRTAERVGRIEAADEVAKREEREEHWRLLYVAMTRAEEALFVGGALGKREDEPKEDSWFAQLAPLVDGLPEDDPVWGWRLTHGEAPEPVGGMPGAAQAITTQTELPAWTAQPIGPEPQPPAPLAPSSAGLDESPSPPIESEALEAAALRGTLIHALIERLPAVPSDDRREGALAWVARREPQLADAARKEIVDSALAVIDDPRFSELFTDRALAEAPFAATVEGQVVAGTVDRLLVTEDTVRIVDFKTTRRPPTDLDAVPISTLRQMAAYVAAMAKIYPDHTVGAAIIYTHAPSLIALPADLMLQHKPRFAEREESFGAPAIV